MSLIKTEYKKQMDEFCNANNMLTADDIIRNAKSKSEQNSKIVKLKAVKKRGMLWKVAIPAMCFLVISTTTLASTGHLGDFIRGFFEDEKTAQIMDEGFYYDVNEMRAEGIFRVNLMGVTGDEENPKVLLDIYVDDEELAAQNDKIHVLAYCLGVKEYENELANYAPWDAYGERDAEVSNLYHVLLPGGWLSTGQEVVVDICQIRLGSRKTAWKTYNVHMEYRMTVPQESFYPVAQIDYDFLEFEHGGIKYYMIWGLYGYYRTELIFRYDYLGTELAGEGSCGAGSRF